MAWQKLKKLFGFSDFGKGPNYNDLDSGASIHKLVNQNHLNKRKNVRINYPHFGAAGLFPHIFYKGHELNVANISLGGLLIVDDTEQFGTQVGEVVNLEFTWSDFTTKLRARLVGANLQRRHLQFVDFNAQAFLRISQLVKSGHTGQRFHRVRNDSGTLQADEMWLGPAGETLVFKTADSPAELTLESRDKFHLKKDQITLLAATKSPVSPAQLNDLMIMLANFPQPTEKIKQLVESLNAEINSLKSRAPRSRTGTNG